MEFYWDARWAALGRACVNLWHDIIWMVLQQWDGNMRIKQKPNSLPRHANQDVSMTTSNDDLPPIVGIVRANGRWRVQEKCKIAHLNSRQKVKKQLKSPFLSPPFQHSEWIYHYNTPGGSRRWNCPAGVHIKCLMMGGQTDTKSCLGAAHERPIRWLSRHVGRCSNKTQLSNYCRWRGGIQHAPPPDWTRRDKANEGFCWEMGSGKQWAVTWTDVNVALCGHGFSFTVMLPWAA